jgi:hypothetical protein
MVQATGWKCLTGQGIRISVTFEMRTTEYSEIYISIDAHTVAERVYKGEEMVGKESKVAERQRERVCVLEC